MHGYALGRRNCTAYDAASMLTTVQQVQPDISTVRYLSATVERMRGYAWIYVIPIQCARISTSVFNSPMLAVRKESTCVSQSADQLSICETYPCIISAAQLQDMRLIIGCLFCSNAMAQATQPTSLSTRYNLQRSLWLRLYNEESHTPLS